MLCPLTRFSMNSSVPYQVLKVDGTILAFIPAMNMTWSGSSSGKDSLSYSQHPRISCTSIDFQVAMCPRRSRQVFLQAWMVQSIRKWHAPSTLSLPEGKAYGEVAFSPASFLVRDMPASPPPHPIATLTNHSWIVTWALSGTWQLYQ